MTTPLARSRARLGRSLCASAATLMLCGCRTTERAPEDHALHERTAAALAPAPPTPDLPAACGAAGQAECPTQRWMKATLQAYLRTHDYERLEASFNDLATHAPDGFEHWASLARSGAQAAARRDEALLRQACQECHDSYRADFRRRMRSRELL